MLDTITNPAKAWHPANVYHSTFYCSASRRRRDEDRQPVAYTQQPHTCTYSCQKDRDRLESVANVILCVLILVTCVAIVLTCWRAR